VLSVVLVTSFGDYKANIRVALVQGKYYGYEISFERLNTKENEIYPIFAGTFWLIWDADNNLVSPPMHPMCPPETIYWIEIRQVTVNHILVNV
jgi:hypothetical protein